MTLHGPSESDYFLSIRHFTKLLNLYFQRRLICLHNHPFNFEKKKRNSPCWLCRCEKVSSAGCRSSRCFNFVALLSRRLVCVHLLVWMNAWISSSSSIMHLTNKNRRLRQGKWISFKPVTSWEFDLATSSIVLGISFRCKFSVQGKHLILHVICLSLISDVVFFLQKLTFLGKGRSTCRKAIEDYIFTGCKISAAALGASVYFVSRFHLICHDLQVTRIAIVHSFSPHHVNKTFE